MNRELEHLKKMRDLLAKGWTHDTWADLLALIDRAIEIAEAEQ